MRGCKELRRHSGPAMPDVPRPDRRTLRRRRKGQESGFALLFVLAAAAIIAIMLYAEIPQVAFEAQRIKEADLIAHGEQYRRAIQLFYRRFGRYPVAISDLENTNNIRFLRRRYKDPMTGKDDWRFIHVSGGVFTDSLTMKPPAVKGATSASDMASSPTTQTAASSGDGSQQAPQRWQLQRSGQPLPGDSSGNPDAQAAYDSLPGAQGVPVVPGQPGDGSVPGTGQPGAPQPGEPGYAPGVILPGQPGYQPGTSASQGYQPGMAPQPGQRPYPPGAQFSNPNAPLYPPVTLPGMATGAGSSNLGPSAATTQTSSGLSQSGSTSSSVGMFGSTTGGSQIAGVASTLKAQGIKVYNDHSKYNEWEFIYDPRQEILGQGGVQPTQSPAGIQSQPGVGTSGTTFGSQLPTQQGTQQPGTSSPTQ